MPLLASIIVCTNIGFTAAFDTVARNPAWVAYDLEPQEVIAAKRPDIPFSPDPRAPESDNAADYLKSGFDRGHLAPSADFNWNTNAQAQTYLFTNIAPQYPFMNRVTWRAVESEVRQLAASGTVHVLTAPVYEGGTNRMGRVRVPDAFVKIAWGSFGFKMWKVANR